MKIVHVVSDYPGKGGIATYLDDLISHFPAESYEIEIVAGGYTEGAFCQEGLNIVHFSKEEDAVCYIKQLHPDIVHVHDWLTDKILEAFYSLPDPKIITHHHAYGFICPGYDYYWRKQNKICKAGFGIRCIANAYFKKCQISRKPRQILKQFWRVRRNMLLSTRVNRFIANSTYVKKRLNERHIPENKITVLHYFTGIRQICERKSVPGKILFIGRLVESKGIDLLFKALCLFRNDLDWLLVIAGDGYFKSGIKAIIMSEGIQERVTFVGWISGEKKIDLLHEASVVVVPSRWAEPFGIVGIEAMACARPVIAFNVGGISDWLKNERTGYLISPNDIREMGDKIKVLLKNRQLANHMGNEGRNEVNRNFLPENHIDSLLKIYEQLSNNDKISSK